MATTREGPGRPTQFHGVPLEDRAVDSQGNRLPWALEWADGNRNLKPTKRVPEEKGSFGKSTRRKGSSRATRTQTPAKKDNPALDGFEAALRFDTQIEAQKSLPTVIQSSKDSSHTKISVNKEPTQAVLYGFPPEMQWAALSFYERVSGGMICEDYDRDPPAERRRYQSGLSSHTGISRRPLTKEETALAMKYRGGPHWIKVTFDTWEAADRAIANSPHVVNGYWVYAQMFSGQAPNLDQPILFKENDRQQGLLGPPKPPQKAVSMGGVAGSRAIQQLESSNATLPRSFDSATIGAMDLTDTFDYDSTSSVTASSATAIAPDEQGMRQRKAADPATDSNLKLSRFPTTPRTVIRPATEALLPQLSLTERILRRLTQGGWIPGDVIGNEVPKTENGEFDWIAASFYWRFCFWVDSRFGTDICALKDT